MNDALWSASSVLPFQLRSGARKPMMSLSGMPANALSALRLPVISDTLGVPACVIVWSAISVLLLTYLREEGEGQRGNPTHQAFVEPGRAGGASKAGGLSAHISVTIE